MELQGRYEEIRKQGLGLIAISYDSPETLKKFADSRGISFPLISDSGSAIIRRFGILNEQQQPGTPSYGVPHPGTFIVDRRGVVTARFNSIWQRQADGRWLVVFDKGGQP
mgnify:CR=1 FL=1